VAEDATAELGRVMESLLGVAAPVRGG
jgi:hypothetical protein